MTALIPTCHNCRTTEALDERHGLLDDEEDDA